MRGHWFYWANLCLISHIPEMLTAISQINIRYACTYFNIFLMVIPNMIMKIPHFLHLVTTFVTFLTRRLHSPAAWKALGPQQNVQNLFITQLSRWNLFVIRLNVFHNWFGSGGFWVIMFLVHPIYYQFYRDEILLVRASLKFLKYYLIIISWSN